MYSVRTLDVGIQVEAELEKLWLLYIFCLPGLW